MQRIGSVVDWERRYRSLSFDLDVVTAASKRVERIAGVVFVSPINCLTDRDRRYEGTVGADRSTERAEAKVRCLQMNGVISTSRYSGATIAATHNNNNESLLMLLLY